MIIWKHANIYFCSHILHDLFLGLIDPEKSQLVLAGDPKQLGPVLRSLVAQQHGLGNHSLKLLHYEASGFRLNIKPVQFRMKRQLDQFSHNLAFGCETGLSLLERMMTQNSLYQKDAQQRYDRRFVTKLLRNYRFSFFLCFSFILPSRMGHGHPSHGRPQFLNIILFILLY